MRKVLLDTNILLDAAMSERPSHAAAMLLLEEAVYGEVIAVMAATSPKDVYYVLCKYAGEQQARAYVQNLLQVVEPVGVDGAVLALASCSDEPDFEDGIVRVCAELSGAQVIISQDERAFQTSAVRRMTAREYLDGFCDIEAVDW